MRRFLFLIIIILLLSACGESDESINTSNGDAIKPIEVNLVVPEEADVGVPISLKVTVTQASEAVADANEIEFEVWKNGEKDKSELIKAEYQGEGVYSSEKVFNENGIYFIQSHVTARDMHTMPKAEIKVGEADSNDGMSEQKNSEQNPNEEHHHHANTTIDFHMPEMISAEKPSSYVVKVMHGSAPLENALIRLEVWKDGSKKHNYVTLGESESGTYQKKMTLENPGTYHITVHVEKDEIHTHKEFKAEVK